MCVYASVLCEPARMTSQLFLENLRILFVQRGFQHFNININILLLLERKYLYFLNKKQLANKVLKQQAFLQINKEMYMSSLNSQVSKDTVVNL